MRTSPRTTLVFLLFLLIVHHVTTTTLAYDRNNGHHLDDDEGDDDDDEDQDLVIDPNGRPFHRTVPGGAYDFFDDDDDDDDEYDEDDMLDIDDDDDDEDIDDIDEIDDDFEEVIQADWDDPEYIDDFSHNDWEVTLQQDMEGNYHLLFERGDVQRNVALDEELSQLTEEEVVALAIDYFDHQAQAWEDSLDAEIEYQSPEDRRQVQRRVLEIFYYALIEDSDEILKDHATSDPTRKVHPLRERGGWLSDQPVCNWYGITCGPIQFPGRYEQKPPTTVTASSSSAQFRRRQEAQQKEREAKNRTKKAVRPPEPDDAITAIILPNAFLNGRLPSELFLLEYLTQLKLPFNDISGTIPLSYAYLSRLRIINLEDNCISGTLPESFANQARDIREINLSHNNLVGTLPSSMKAWRKLWAFDVSDNFLTGQLPKHLSLLTDMVFFHVHDNALTGSFPTTFTQLNDLHVLDVSYNALSGPLPNPIDDYPLLEDLDVSHNLFTGTVPPRLLNLKQLELLDLSHNWFWGPLPVGGENQIVEPDPFMESVPPVPGEWSALSHLRIFKINHNHLTGSIPSVLLQGVQQSLAEMDVSFNRLTGTLPTQLGQATMLRTIYAQGNRLSGSLPTEMLNLNPNLRLNFTDNLLTGSIPELFCGIVAGKKSTNMLYQESGCDAVLCRPGTFNVHGHATLYSSCRFCQNTPKGEEKVLGRVSCQGLEHVHGDLDGDGLVSAREILRLIYIDNLGRFWGPSYQNWADTNVNECDLAGITCVKGKVAKIDLSGANLCSNGDRGPGPEQFCLGLPSEIGQLNTLEVFQATRRPYFRGTIPTEMGQLSRLRYLDLSHVGMWGTLPTELGRLALLKFLIVSHCPFTGTIPSQLFQLTMLEKLHLTNNNLSGTLPSDIRAESLRELMIARNKLTGTLPSELGFLGRLENLEGYSNHFEGTIPPTLGTCTNLMRIDLFKNHLVGTIPKELADMKKLQILHLKENSLSGTIPASLGSLPSITWIDLSHNRLHGSIPSSFGNSGSNTHSASSLTLKDLRLANNMLHDPIPPEMCHGKNLHGGATEAYGCDAVICPLGTYSELGHATNEEGCIPCPAGQSTLYLGSTSCRSFSQTDILSIFYEVMQGSLWPPEYRESWQKLRSQTDTSSSHADFCSWYGVKCNDNGELTDIRFPLIGTDGEPM